MSELELCKNAKFNDNEKYYECELYKKECPFLIPTEHDGNYLFNRCLKNTDKRDIKY